MQVETTRSDNNFLLKNFFQFKKSSVKRCYWYRCISSHTLLINDTNMMWIRSFQFFAWQSQLLVCVSSLSCKAWLPGTLLRHWETNSTCPGREDGTYFWALVWRINFNKTYNGPFYKKTESIKNRLCFIFTFPSLIKQPTLRDVTTGSPRNDVWGTSAKIPY